jgi:hypothetical protein
MNLALLAVCVVVLSLAEATILSSSMTRVNFAKAAALIFLTLGLLSYVDHPLSAVDFLLLFAIAALSIPIMQWLDRGNDPE